MCGRYITPDQAALEREWAALPRDIEYFQSWNFAPSLTGPVVIAASREPSPDVQIAMMTWGFQTYWAKRSWINTRAETVFVKSRSLSTMESLLF